MSLKTVNERKVWNVVNLLETALVDADIEYENAFAACLYIATVSANNMHMGKELFLKNCESMYSMDIEMMQKEMQ